MPGFVARHRGVRTRRGWGPAASGKTMEAILALEDGTMFRGVAAGAEGEAGGEVVFNTSLTGYQEILTDPSYAGQIVTMTCAEIGNYGVSPDDVESRKPQVAGFIIRDESPVASNWRAEATLRDYLVANRIVAISDIDTRALTRLLRSGGVMRGVIATGDRARRRRRWSSARMRFRRWKARTSSGRSLRIGRSTGRLRIPTSSASCPTAVPKRRLKVAAYDFGMKWNIMRRLSAHGCDVRVYPAATPAAEMLAIESGRRVPEQRSRRSRAADLRHRQREGAGRRRRAGVRHLPRPPDSRPGDGRQDVQAEVRTPRREPSGEAARDGQDRDHVAEPRLRGRSRHRCPRTSR